ncbi:hypothetical protein [Helicobacter typhlonius]|uniref:hypothetical protein n=1 Tax=Helicobacter typhlonius TaxID=76936 RepID=UPI002FDFFA3E
MAFFKTTLPIIPDNVPIHHIDNTPQLKRAKGLFIAVLILNILYICFAFSFALSSIATAEGILLNYEEVMKDVMFYAYIVNFISVIGVFFALFYISKLSLRRRAFNLYIALFVISAIINCISFFGRNDLYTLENMELNTFIVLYLIFILIAIPVCIYLQWQLSKELSFVLHDGLFFQGFKILIVSVIGLILMYIVMISVLIFDSMAILVIALIGLMSFNILAIVGGIMFLIAIFRIRQVVAYGENIRNPIS